MPLPNVQRKIKFNANFIISVSLSWSVIPQTKKSQKYQIKRD